MIKSKSIIPALNKDAYPSIHEPVLAKINDSDTIVLFTAPTSGTVLTEGSGLHYLGDYRKDWIHINDKETWTILPKGSQIILTVE